MNGKPTAAQKKFHDWVISKGCQISGEPAELHHINGARMKLKGVDGYAGEWYVIALSPFWHRQGRDAVHSNRKSFEKETQATERELWSEVMEDYYNEFQKYPMPDSEYKIILERG